MTPAILGLSLLLQIKNNMATENGEFATEPVPDSHTVAWYRVAFVAAMVAFSLPTFLTGVEVAVATTPRLAFEMLLVGSIILTVIGSITAAIGASTRLNSYMLNRIAFGNRGAALVNLAFALSLFSGAVQRMAVDAFGYSLPNWPIELFAGVVMTVTTILGFRAINILSMLLVPVLIVVTAQLIAGSLEITPLSELMSLPSGGDLTFGDGVSAVVGAVIIGAVILPDVTRFISHWSGAVYVVLISYLVIELIVTCAGGMAAIALGDLDLLNIMITLGIGGSAFAIVIFGSWVLNSLNLYSASLSVESTLPSMREALLYHVDLQGVVSGFDRHCYDQSFMIIGKAFCHKAS